MRVLICEAESQAADLLARVVDEAGFQYVGLATNLARARELIETRTPDLVLINIDFGGKLMGVETAQAVICPCKMPFIYITKVLDLQSVQASLSSNPVAYLGRSEDVKTMAENLKTATFKLRQTGLPLKPVIIKLGRESLEVEIEQLVHIEAFANYMELVYEDNRKVVVRTTLSTLEKNLPENFVRVHKSFIINKVYLVCNLGGKVIVGDKVIPVGRSHKAKVANLH